MDESNEPLRRRNATKTKRVGALSSEEITVPKGPTIVHTSEAVRLLRYTEFYGGFYLSFPQFLLP